MLTSFNSLPVVYLNESIEIPMQHSYSYYEEKVIDAVSTAVTVLNVASASTFALMMVVNFALSEILGNISALTVICTLYCAGFKYPALSLEIGSILLKFVQFDLFDCGPIFD
jgi:hypothetical protein